MNVYEQNLLRRCWQLTEELAGSEPPEWQTWVYRDWLQQAAYGPRYFIGKWFGPLPERERQRYRRALDRLAELGLVTLHREWDARLSNVKLTAEGERIARALLEAEVQSNGQ